MDEARPAPKSSTMLAILFVIALFNYMDRTLINILQIPIKAELHLSDAMMGFLTGLSFAIIYAVTAIPISRVADRSSRKRVMLISFGVWSSATALIGFAANFAQLAMLRMLVAAGESGCVPTSHSLLSDLYPPERRATAISVWSLSAPLGITLGMLLAGWLSLYATWREIFIAMGLVSLLITLVAYFLLKEPTRGRFDAPDTAIATPTVREATRLLWENRPIRYLFMATSAHSYFFYTQTSWIAPFYSRVYGMELSRIAFWQAVIGGLGGGLGTYLGGAVADRWGARRPKVRLLLPALACFVTIPFAIWQYWAVDVKTSLIASVLPGIASLIYLAPVVAITQSLVPSRIRAFTSASLILVAILFGMGLGPLLTGALIDVVRSLLNSDAVAVRIALTSSLTLELIAALLFVQAYKAKQ